MTLSTDIFKTRAKETLLPLVLLYISLVSLYSLVPIQSDLFICIYKVKSKWHNKKGQVNTWTLVQYKVTACKIKLFKVIVRSGISFIHRVVDVCCCIQGNRQSIQLDKRIQFCILFLWRIASIDTIIWKYILSRTRAGSLKQ